MPPSRIRVATLLDSEVDDNAYTHPLARLYLQRAMNAPDTSKRFGKNMAFIAWIIGIALLTQLFGAWEENQQFPNQSPAYSESAEDRRLELRQNRQGHYLVGGQINQKEALFMLDTGATDVVIPASLGERYGLQVFAQGRGMTANGPVDISHTRISELRLGPIVLYDVAASLNPGMGQDMPILLGMSALRKLEMSQKDKLLILKQNN